MNQNSRPGPANPGARTKHISPKTFLKRKCSRPLTSEGPPYSRAAIRFHNMEMWVLRPEVRRERRLRARCLDMVPDGTGERRAARGEGRM